MVKAKIGSAASKGERTRERIIEAAADLFHRQGVNATSLGDVLRAAKAGKGQFYLHFKDRDALVLEVFGRHRATLEAQRFAVIESWDDLKRWMESHLEMQRLFRFKRGCPIGTAAYALQAEQDAARDSIGRIFGDFRAGIIAFLKRERGAGRLCAEADPARLADFAIACVQGGMILGLLERGPRAARAAIEEGFAHLRSHAR